jgi:hypothetical protein
VWRTVSLLSGTASLNTTEADDDWYLVPNTPEPGVGTVKFATACVTAITFRCTFDKDSDNDTAKVEFRLNGEPVATIEAPSLVAGVHVDRTIDVTGRPCGNIFEITGTMTNSGSGDVFIRLGIVDVA